MDNKQVNFINFLHTLSDEELERQAEWYVWDANSWEFSLICDEIERREQFRTI